MRLINIINFFVWKFRLQKQRPSKYDRPSHSTDFDCTGPSKTKSLEIWPTAPLYPTLCLYEQSCFCIQTVNVNSSVELSMFKHASVKGSLLRMHVASVHDKRNHSLLHSTQIVMWPTMFYQFMIKINLSNVRFMTK